MFDRSFKGVHTRRAREHPAGRPRHGLSSARKQSAPVSELTDVVAAGAAVRPNNGTTMASSARPSPRRRSTSNRAGSSGATMTWHGKQELRAHNRAFDASQLEKRAQRSAATPTPPRVDDKAAIRKAQGRGAPAVLAYKRRQQHVPVIQAVPTPQTYDDDSFEFEEAAPTKMPWYSQDRAKRLASKHHKERREAALRQKEAQRKHRETVEARLERVQQTILRRRRDRQGTFRKGSAVLVEEQPARKNAELEA